MTFLNTVHIQLPQVPHLMLHISYLRHHTFGLSHSRSCWPMVVARHSTCFAFSVCGLATIAKHLFRMAIHARKRRGFATGCHGNACEFVYHATIFFLLHPAIPKFQHIQRQRRDFPIYLCTSCRVSLATIVCLLCVCPKFGLSL